MIAIPTSLFYSIKLTNAYFLPLFLQQQQRPDLARLMQMTAQAQAGQLPPGGPAGLPPGLLAAGHPNAPGAAAAAAAAAGLPTTLSLLAGIPTSLAQSGPSLPHPAFASLLAQQKPGADLAKAKEEELKRAAETNGGNGIILST